MRSPPRSVVLPVPYGFPAGRIPTGIPDVTAADGSVGNAAAVRERVLPRVTPPGSIYLRPFWMACMPLPRPPLQVCVTPSAWDVAATVMGTLATWGTAAVLLFATLVYAWQIIRLGGGRRDRR